MEGPEAPDAQTLGPKAGASQIADAPSAPRAVVFIDWREVLRRHRPWRGGRCWLHRMKQRRDDCRGDELRDQRMEDAGRWNPLGWVSGTSGSCIEYELGQFP